MVALLEEKRGAITVQVALFLPILILIVLGGFEVWKVLYMQQLLNDAAYQGVRVLALQPKKEDTPLQVEAMVRRYIAEAPFVDPALKANPDNRDLLHVTVNVGNFRCGDPISLEIALYWKVGQEWLGNPSGWLSFLKMRGWLKARAEGVILCERQEDVQ